MNEECTTCSGECPECGNRIDSLRSAAQNLLDFIRSKYPEDFTEGGCGFICPYHIALDKALRGEGA